MKVRGILDALSQLRKDGTVQENIIILEKLANALRVKKGCSTESIICYAFNDIQFDRSATNDEYHLAINKVYALMRSLLMKQNKFFTSAATKNKKDTDAILEMINKLIQVSPHIDGFQDDPGLIKHIFHTLATTATHPSIIAEALRSFSQLAEKTCCPDFVNLQRDFTDLLLQFIKLSPQSQLISLVMIALRDLAIVDQCPDLSDEKVVFVKLITLLDKSASTSVHTPHIAKLFAALDLLTERKLCPNLREQESAFCSLLAKLANEKHLKAQHASMVLSGLGELAEKGKCPNLSKARIHLSKIMTALPLADDFRAQSAAMVFSGIGKLAKAGVLSVPENDVMPAQQTTAAPKMKSDTNDFSERKREYSLSSSSSPQHDQVPPATVANSTEIISEATTTTILFAMKNAFDLSVQHIGMAALGLGELAENDHCPDVGHVVMDIVTILPSLLGRPQQNKKQNEKTNKKKNIHHNQSFSANIAMAVCGLGKLIKNEKASRVVEKDMVCVNKLILLFNTLPSGAHEISMLLSGLGKLSSMCPLLNQETIFILLQGILKSGHLRPADIAQAPFALGELAEADKCPALTSNDNLIYDLFKQLPQAISANADDPQICGNIAMAINGMGKLIAKGRIQALPQSKTKTIISLLSEFAKRNPNDKEIALLFSGLGKWAASGKSLDLTKETSTISAILSKLKKPDAIKIGNILLGLGELAEAKSIAPLECETIINTLVTQLPHAEYYKASAAAMALLGIGKLVESDKCPTLNALAKATILSMLPQFVSLNPTTHELIMVLAGLSKLSHQEEQCPNFKTQDQFISELLSIARNDPNIEPSNIGIIFSSLGKLAEANLCPDLTLQLDTMCDMIFILIQSQKFNLQAYSMVFFSLSTLEFPINGRLANAIDVLMTTIQPRVAECLSRTNNDDFLQSYHAFLAYLLLQNYGDKLAITAQYQQISACLQHNQRNPISGTHRHYHLRLQECLRARFSHKVIARDEYPESGQYIDIAIVTDEQEILLGVEINGPTHYTKQGQMRVCDKNREQRLKKFDWELCHYQAATGEEKDIISSIPRMDKHINEVVIPQVEMALRRLPTLPKIKKAVPMKSTQPLASAATLPEPSNELPISAHAETNSLITSIDLEQKRIHDNRDHHLKRKRSRSPKAQRSTNTDHRERDHQSDNADRYRDHSSPKRPSEARYSYSSSHSQGNSKQGDRDRHRDRSSPKREPKPRYSYSSSSRVVNALTTRDPQMRGDVNRNGNSSPASRRIDRNNDRQRDYPRDRIERHYDAPPPFMGSFYPPHFMFSPPLLLPYVPVDPIDRGENNRRRRRK